MRNKSKPVSLQSSKQELFDEVEYLREKIASREAGRKFRQELKNNLSAAIKLGYWEWDEIENRPSYFSQEMVTILGMDLASLYEQYQCEEDPFHLIHPDDLDHYRNNTGVGLALASLQGKGCSEY